MTDNVSDSDLHVGEELESVLLCATGESHAAEGLSIYTQLPLHHQRLHLLEQGHREKRNKKLLHINQIYTKHIYTMSALKTKHKVFTGFSYCAQTTVVLCFILLLLNFNSTVFSSV